LPISRSIANRPAPTILLPASRSGASLAAFKVDIDFIEMGLTNIKV